MDTILKVAAGADLYRPFQAVDYNGVPIVGTFRDSDVLSGSIWPAGSSPASKLTAAPALVWISAAAGTWSIEWHSAVTVTIPPGVYSGLVVATRGSDAAELLAFTLVITAYGVVFAPVPVSTVPTQATAQRLETLYCTDEDIAVKVGTEFVTLVHDDQLIAAGSDGSFSSGDPWTLTSPSSGFLVQGVTTGSIVHLRKPSSAFPAGGHLLAVSAVGGSSLTLRRKGLPAGTGLAPAPSTGLTGVDFAVKTFSPQIESETFEINQKYSIDPAYGGRTPSELYDLRVLRRACVLRVLLNRYLVVSAAGSGDYRVKIDQTRFELGEVEAKLQLRWGTAPTNPEISSLFTTRIER